MVTAQSPSIGPRALLEEMKFEVNYGPNDGFNRFSSILMPKRIIQAQTPIVVRWAVVFLVPQHDVYAGCNPQRLSFFATNDTIPEHLCTNPLSIRLIENYAINYVYRKQYPIMGKRFTQYLISLGLDPLSTSTDLNTPSGWANLFGARIHKYFKNDGWNPLGAHRKDFGLSYADSTGYRPKNAPGVPVKKLKYPLRWQPLRQTDFIGNFFTQEHVTPHIGRTAKPLLMPRKELFKKKTEGPYRYPNRRHIHPVDRKLILREARDLFRRSARLSTKRIQEAFFWDVKFFSTGLTGTYYLQQFLQRGLIKGDNATDLGNRLNLVEGLAMHDATILAWHEKRRHDAARPQTLIRHAFGPDKKFKAFRGFGRGFGTVRAVEWEPLIPAQPHSEYPSGSAMLCTANYEALDLGLRDILGLNKNDTVPPLILKRPHTAVPGPPLLDDVSFTFKDPQQMAYRCGMSRLWAGVHFSKSIKDGFSAAKGIGTVAHKFVDDLRHGRVPKYCPHCLVNDRGSL